MPASESKPPSANATTLSNSLSPADLDRAKAKVEERLHETPMHFDAGFENGSLDRVVRLGPDWYHIELRPDTWYRFHFRVKQCRGREAIFEFTCRNMNRDGIDAGKNRWTKSGRLVQPRISYDGKTWQPVDHFEQHAQDPGKYRFRHRFTEDVAWICHHQPYTYSDMLEWLKTVQDRPAVRCETLGHTRNGFLQPVLTIGDTPAPKDLVVILGREDADENVGSWGVEGLVETLCSDAFRPLTKQVTFKIVPMVGIDGVVAGAHHSAGYGYGGGCWHLEPAPTEIENVKNGIRRWIEVGHRVVLAGKIHSPQSFTHDVGYDAILTASASVKKIIENEMARFSEGKWQATKSPSRDLAIRPKGYFERFILDEFGLYDVFGTHLHGESADNARSSGAGLMHGIREWLEAR